MHLTSLLLLTIHAFMTFTPLVTADAVTSLSILQTQLHDAAQAIDSSVVSPANATSNSNDIDNGTWRVVGGTSKAKRQAGGAAAGNRQIVRLGVGKDFPTEPTLNNLTTAIREAERYYTDNFSEWQGETQFADIDNAYLGYINEVPDVAQAISTRGRSWHSELNAPVQEAITDLAEAVHSYSTALSRRGLLGRVSSIRTFSAGNTLVTAGSRWMKGGKLPGRRV